MLLLDTIYVLNKCIRVTPTLMTGANKENTETKINGKKDQKFTIAIRKLLRWSLRTTSIKSWEFTGSRKLLQDANTIAEIFCLLQKK